MSDLNVLIGYGLWRALGPTGFQEWLSPMNLGFGARVLDHTSAATRSACVDRALAWSRHTFQHCTVIRDAMRFVCESACDGNLPLLNFIPHYILNATFGDKQTFRDAQAPFSRRMVLLQMVARAVNIASIQHVPHIPYASLLTWSLATGFAWSHVRCFELYGQACHPSLTFLIDAPSAVEALRALGIHMQAGQAHSKLSALRTWNDHIEVLSGFLLHAAELLDREAFCLRLALRPASFAMMHRVLNVHTRGKEPYAKHVKNSQRLYDALSSGGQELYASAVQQFGDLAYTALATLPFQMASQVAGRAQLLKIVDLMRIIVNTVNLPPSFRKASSARSDMQALILWAKAMIEHQSAFRGLEHALSMPYPLLTLLWVERVIGMSLSTHDGEATLEAWLDVLDKLLEYQERALHAPTPLHCLTCAALESAAQRTPSARQRRRILNAPAFARTEAVVSRINDQMKALWFVKHLAETANDAKRDHGLLEKLKFLDDLLSTRSSPPFCPDSDNCTHCSHPRHG